MSYGIRSGQNGSESRNNTSSVPQDRNLGTCMVGSLGINGNARTRLLLWKRQRAPNGEMVHDSVQQCSVSRWEGATAPAEAQINCIDQCCSSWYKPMSASRDRDRKRREGAQGGR